MTAAEKLHLFRAPASVRQRVLGLSCICEAFYENITFIKGGWTWTQLKAVIFVDHPGCLEGAVAWGRIKSSSEVMPSIPPISVIPAKSFLIRRRNLTNMIWRIQILSNPHKCLFWCDDSLMFALPNQIKWMPLIQTVRHTLLTKSTAQPDMSTSQIQKNNIMFYIFSSLQRKKLHFLSCTPFGDLSLPIKKKSKKSGKKPWIDAGINYF